MEDCGLDDEDLVRELLDDDSPFILLPTSSENEPERESNVNRFIPRVFNGPTIFDIENALLVCDWKLVPERRSSSNTIPAATRTATAATTTTTTGFASALSFVKGLEKNKMENKYTLRVKCSENGTVDDGYKWRKYGQKTIKNSPNPRSYYRCTSPQCSAKKQVERSTVDPETLVVTYEGLHLHYAYPFFQFMQQTMEPAAEPTKRPRLDWVETMVGPLEDPSLITSLQHDQQPQPQANCLNSFAKGDQTSPILPAQPTPLGLLQDVVPMAVMNPLKSPCYDIMSSPSSSSPSWFTNGCYDVGILSTK